MIEEDWEPRIGREATQTLKSAYQYVRFFFLSGLIMVGVASAAVFSRTMPLWFSILGSIATVVWLSAMALALGTFSVRRKRAGRQAWEYLGRPPQCRQRRILRFALRDPEVFDNYLAEKGITPKGNYPSLASAKAIAKGTRTHPAQKDPARVKPRPIDEP